MITPPLLDEHYWRGKRVVVTGGGGFIGSHVVERLLPACGEIVVPSRGRAAPANLSHLASDIKFLSGDLREPAAALSTCDGADVVLMLAAIVGGIEYNNAHHASIFRDNMSAFLGTLEACRLLEVPRVLVTSSACVYPRECRIPTPEADGFVGRPEPTNEGYGWAKRMEEYLASAYTAEYGMSIAVARPYNAYGPRDDFHPSTSHVIPALVRRAFESGPEELVVWGSGKQSRSFLFATDFADGLIRICERATNAEPTNLGANEETTIADVANLIVELSGTGKRVVFDTSKPEGQPRRHCDTTRLEAEFGFAARVGLEDGLEATTSYFRNSLIG